jgi:hypothetical protein
MTAQGWAVHETVSLDHVVAVQSRVTLPEYPEAEHVSVHVPPEATGEEEQAEENAVDSEVPPSGMLEHEPAVHAGTEELVHDVPEQTLVTAPSYPAVEQVSVQLPPEPVSDDGHALVYD